MSALKEKLGWWQERQELRTKLAAAYDRIDERTQERELVLATAELLAGAVTRSAEFGDWLLMQDASSAVSFSPARKRKMIEDKTDLELALEFIASTAAG